MKKITLYYIAVAIFACAVPAVAAPQPMNFGQNVGPMNGDGVLETEQKVLLTLAGYQGATRVNSSAYEASHVLKAGAGSLVSLFGYNSGPAQFIQVFDAATLPADGAAPIAVFAVPGSSNFSLDIALIGLPCTAGIVVCNSSTAPTKTVGSANVYFTAVVK